MLEPNISVENPFFIFFPERSGSTFLVHLLNAHPDIHCDHELFFVKKDESGRSTIPGLTSNSEKTQVLEKVYSYQEVKASGFKFKFNAQYDAYPDVYRFFLRNVESFRMIFLYRKNLLKSAISRQNLSRLRQAGEKHFLQNENIQDFGKLELNLQQARRYINFASRELEFHQRATSIFPNRLEVTYEDLIADTPGTLRKIHQFLGVNPVGETTDVPIRKITDDQLDQAIANYDEMIQFFQETRFAEYLDV